MRLAKTLIQKEIDKKKRMKSRLKDTISSTDPKEAKTQDGKRSIKLHEEGIKLADDLINELETDLKKL